MEKAPRGEGALGQERVDWGLRPSPAGHPPAAAAAAPPPPSQALGAQYSWACEGRHGRDSKSKESEQECVRSLPARQREAAADASRHVNRGESVATVRPPRSMVWPHSTWAGSGLGGTNRSSKPRRRPSLSRACRPCKGQAHWKKRRGQARFKRRRSPRRRSSRFDRLGSTCGRCLPRFRLRVGFTAETCSASSYDPSLRPPRLTSIKPVSGRVPMPSPGYG